MKKKEDSSPPETVEEAPPELKTGLTWRAMLAIVFAAVTLLPTSIYLTLVSGVGMVGPATITAILFTELARLMGKRLTKQEMFVIYMVAGTAAYAPFLELVFRSYYVTSPLTWNFADPATGLPLPTQIPYWYAPPYGSSAHLMRTFLSLDWVVPVALRVLAVALIIPYDIALTYICTGLYVDIERLPFPFASVDAQMVITLTERKSEKIRIFMLSAIGAMLYAFLLYFVPLVSFGVFNIEVQLIPIPWIDFTSGPMGIENILPGAVFGIGTDLLAYVAGFLYSTTLFNVAVCMLISSIAVYVFGNNLALTVFGEHFPDWVREWLPGAGLRYNYFRSSIRVWIAPGIGFTLAVSAILLARHSKSIAQGFKSLARLSTVKRRAGYLSLPKLLAIYFGASGASVIVFHLLVPEFPLWILILLSMGWGIVHAIISARSVGITGRGIDIPYLWSGSILLSGYPGVDAWFAAPIIGGAAAPGWTQTMKVAYLTETKLSDFFKAFIISAALYYPLSFFFVSFFWSMAPMPSAVYPWTAIAWPRDVISNSMWFTRQLFAEFKPYIIINSFILMLVVGGIGELTNRFAGIPFSLIGVLVGIGATPMYTVPLFVGAVLGRYVLRRRFGKEWWDENRAVIVAGVVAGEGIIVGIAVALIMISKATWVLPF